MPMQLIGRCLYRMLRGPSDMLSCVQRPTAVAVAPARNLLVVGSAGHIATFDAATTVRQALVPIPGGHTPRLIQVTPSGNHLLIACAEWVIYHISLKTMKPALLLSLKDVKKRPLDNPLMCFMAAFPGSKRVPVLFVTNKLKDSVRATYLASVVAAEAGDGDAAGTSAAAPPPKEATGVKGKGVEQNIKLPLEKNKGAVALAAHPYAPILYVLTVNGELQVYQHVQGANALTPLQQFTSAHTT